MGSALVLAVDVGTSATKALLFDRDLNQKALCRAHNRVLNQTRAMNEQDPEALLHGVLEAMAEVLRTMQPSDRLAGVVFSSQMYSVLAIDGAGTPLTNSLTWLDHRAAEIASDLQTHPLAHQISDTTGCPIDSVFPLSKIIWLKEHGRVPGTARFISIKDYILYRLTGRLLTDWTIGSSSGLMDIRQNKWDSDALSLAKLEPVNLPALASPDTVLVEWLPAVAEMVRVPAGTPIILGSGDGPLASVGIGALSPEILAINVGTSAAVRSIIGTPERDPRNGLYTQVLDAHHWVMGGMTRSGGIVHEWFLEQFCSSMTHDGLPVVTQEDRETAEELAASIPPGSDGLMFIPYLSGEQSPGWHPNLRGAFVGLTLKHSRAHMARSVLEGITRSLYRIADAFEAVPFFQDLQFREIRVTGGLTASPLWVQIAADVFNLPVVVPEVVEGSARGAAILAWSALSELDATDYLRPFPIKSYTEPNGHAHQQYQEQFYEENWDLLRDARF